MGKKASEQRARQVARELLNFRKWDTNSIEKKGQLLEENEYKNYTTLESLFKGKSKTGSGDTRPDFLLVDSFQGLRPILIIETKASIKQAEEAIQESTHYGNACLEKGHEVLCVGIAGAEKEICSVIVKRYSKGSWKLLTLNGKPIDWIPSPEQTKLILSKKDLLEVKPERPTEEVLNEQATKLNEILRECKIKDEYRPTYVATFMLALWKGDVSTDPDVVLTQVNSNAELALKNAKKPELSHSLRVDDENSILSQRAWEIIDILKKLNIRSFLQEHDYLGQLYETFFRYTGGNTIGQYFTPRHIISFMTEILDVNKTDIILDPACGTGGFLIGVLNQMIHRDNLSYEESLEKIKNNLYGIESEPATAALCITNMILRGDGKSGIIKEDCFKIPNYPDKEVDFVLMNPPFPHDKKTDTLATDFIDRGLKSLKKRGILAAIVPYSLLVNTKDWHKKILKDNSLHFIATLPPDLFNPYASYNTAVLMIQKGLPHEEKKCFVCKITNDGFKLKKNNRIPQPGSQLETIKKCFEKKSEKPELCAFPTININSEEWSPEAYIKNAPHDDEEFIKYFEEHIRKQASFYVSQGQKLIRSKKNVKFNYKIDSLFETKSSVDLKGIKMGVFKIDDYFEVLLGGKEEIEDLDEGDLPIVSTSEFMNGVTAWKSSTTIFNGQTITVATDGSTCSSFVQEYPYYAFYKVAILTARKEHTISIDALYYVAYLLSREKWRYVYARKFGKTRIKETVLYCPVDDKGKPDFKKMEQLVKQTKAYPIIEFFRDYIK